MLCPAGLSYACFLPCTSCLISGPQRWTWREVVTSISPPFSMCSHRKSLLFLISTIIVCLIVSWRWMFEPTLLGLLGSKLCLQGQIDGRDGYMNGRDLYPFLHICQSELIVLEQSNQLNRARWIWAYSQVETEGRLLACSPISQKTMSPTSKGNCWVTRAGVLCQPSTHSPQTFLTPLLPGVPCKT